MAQKLFQGNEAIGVGAINAGCSGFFGYPITPQNEITEWFAQELPGRGGVFVQSQCETGSINMLYGASATGARCITSTSSPGWGLMQETISHMVNAQLPCVIVLVQRAGPGQGTTQQGQMDYLSATRGGGQGGYKNIVLAPASVQENCDLVQLAFYLADKYRNPVIVLTDAIIGQMAEPLEIRSIDFGPLPKKEWALTGTKYRSNGRPSFISCSEGAIPSESHPTYLALIENLSRKYQAMTNEEVRVESYLMEETELVLVAYGYTARVCKAAVKAARKEGIKAGLLRPITLWPFPEKPLAELASQGKRFLVVEDSLGQLVDDVRLAGVDRRVIHFLGVLARHSPTSEGMILPKRVLEEIMRII
ncbi:MAG: 3-methyl-2-oxobutanoate dehydrogenase subunit VorB [Candidatus Tectomicrobia bacterium]|uniref:3-methyl-2-oxobutanoate dehydrogenase subunit VorB n=1 Tax=Tectimicrobiota bacterium TaxID=2528274 RepID=A0A933LQ02_UNCTE|nr:3-methyl-2-oxobutanoate dehydrogenase subunit VorB [Candidatus Tectomicrobia bacterium]